MVAWVRTEKKKKKKKKQKRKNKMGKRWVVWLGFLVDVDEGCVVSPSIFK
jgi:hypothetical protein